jgi:autotransporter strand-loop-strand O-heptosyltransferase
MENMFNEDVFVIDSWPNTKEKEDTLIDLIKRLKHFNIPIILAGHFPISSYIQELVDYYIFDKKNDLVHIYEFEKYNINSDRWTETNDYRVTNKVEFHHDYSIWLTMKSAFNLANQLGKKYIHFLEYDNLPELVQYRQSFIEYIRHNDAVLFEYDRGSTKYNDPYCSTFIFSIRTDVALSLINQINTKEEYFTGDPHKWQLEKRFFNALRSVTSNYCVSKYIPNNNELNIFAAWNRDGILRNGAKFQSYLCTDGKDLYLHLISGFHNEPAEQDYLIEVVVKNIVHSDEDKSFFYTLKKGEYQLIKLCEFRSLLTVDLYYQGVKVFRDAVTQDLEHFMYKNTLAWKNVISNRPQVNINFIDGAFVEILNNKELNYNVKFINKKNNNVEFDVDLKSNHWAKSVIKHYVNWLIVVRGIDNDFYEEHHFNLENKRVLISFESKSLGDTLAFMPHVDRFKITHNCDVICSTFHNDLFKNQYNNIEFVEPGQTVFNINAQYRLGIFYNNDQIDYERHPYDPLKEPLSKIASDILGLDYIENKPRVPILGKNKKKRVCIAIHSTSQAKYWNNPNGWQEVIDHLVNKGYEVRLLSNEPDGYMGNVILKNVVKQKNGSLIELIKVLQESEFFIGISSGLSWLAWASGIPTVIISGFTDKYLEPMNDVYRVINKEVCNGCWHTHKFDPGDWNWCPIHKNTKKQFECTKEITSYNVIEKIKQLIN